ncbi:HlyD family secretion protein [Novipirellula artificiosorum]|uniref:Multidrug resistance protein MdtN n=1 Tax=Novipirellula artificiosorum TaxID=2528016 RepID=A0A5C6DTR9_9BACT|nr:HlyD family efflux transporter periplasmic adaptor subunit [Novipirellula artificiosorum]TWU39725.1 Multidrug resistance protein MdtN [Novipirellula artificiosorum]
MRTIFTAIATIVIFGSALAVHEHRRQSLGIGTQPLDGVPIQALVTQRTIRAAGRIEGRTDSIEIRARLAEQIDDIFVARGQWVSAGDVLLALDAARFIKECDLAQALLSEANAKKERLENGYRASEIETARQEYNATMARLAGSEKAYARAIKLHEQGAGSQQVLDDLYSQLTSFRATSAAAKGRLEMLELPARAEDLMATRAAVGAAEARYAIAKINLDRTRIVAPIDGQILAIEAEVGELTGPDAADALIVMSDTKRLKAVAEVDEFDAMNVRLGQVCQVICDASDRVIATGKVVEVEPQMNPKRMYGQWAGERTDTYNRRIWVDLQQGTDLPVGLPVDVFIQAD